MAWNLRPEHLIAAAIVLTYAVMLAGERVRPARRWPTRRHWPLIGVAGFVMLGVINGLVAAALSRAWPGHSLVDGTRLGIVGGTIVGYLVLSLGNAAMHLAYHRSDFLWRHVHQLHHAPPRLDVAGVMYQTPWEALGSALLFVLVTVFVLGLDPVAAMACAYLGAFYGMFQHLNMATPRWLGVLIQRPESHCRHHEYGVHAGNYSDLPLWDWLFGTFSNPARFDGRLGFDGDASCREWAMLRGVDVNRDRLR